MTERLARVAARHPKRMVALWVVIFVLSVAAIALLLPSAITTDSRVTSKPESERGYELMGERLPRSDEVVNEIVLVRAPGRDVTTDVPASLLQRHPAVTVVADAAALGRFGS